MQKLGQMKVKRPSLKQSLPETELVPKSYCCEDVILQTLMPNFYFWNYFALLSALLVKTMALSLGYNPVLPPVLTAMASGHVHTPFK